MRDTVEQLLAARRHINTGIDVIAHNPQMVHGAYAAGPIAYTTWIKAAGLYWHRPLRNQLKRWQQYAAAQRPAA